MKVLMSGGGTAGHVHPALSVAARFVAEHDEVVFVGTPGGLEARIVPEAGVRFVALPAAGFDRARPWTLVTSSVRIAASAVRAASLLRRERPDVVLGFGGYVSIPVGVAAVLSGIPLVLHEQNSVPGLANRLLARRAERVAVTYEESAGLLAHPERVEVTGNPVRDDVLSADRVAGRTSLGIPEGSLLLLVFGGSRGARHINSAIVGLARRLAEIPGLHILHAAGSAEGDSVRAALADTGVDLGERWRVVDYVEDMGPALAAADLVVARAGATSIAELTALGVASVLVPYPYATDDHQTRNASTLAEHGAALVVADADIDSAEFGEALVALLGDPSRRATMSAASRALGRADAAARVVSLTRSVAERSDRKR